jgi:undecaprenyl diphosphate synthase
VVVEARLATASSKSIYPLPTHVAIIMDGNGRWAAKRGMNRLFGHRAGTDKVRQVVEGFHKHGVKYLTLYAFSTENWRRPGVEVRGLMGILAEMIDRETKALHKKGVKLAHLGRIDELAPELQAKVRDAIDLTKDNTEMTLSIAFDYGGRAEILEAVRRVIRQGIPADQITENVFGSYLYTANLPEPDLIIRTGGEMRLSNFLIWQAAYSEFYCTPTLWPDFGDNEIGEALIAYSRRERRFGGLKAEEEAREGH